MPASPSQVRADLTVVTAAAIADVQAVVESDASPAQIRAAMFAAAPLIVGTYGDGAAALALDWYQELRDDAETSQDFTPSPLALVDEGDLATSVAVATRPLHDLETGRTAADFFERARLESLALLEPMIQKQVATGFWDTITGNSEADPDAQGWQRFARAGACKFCLMLAGRGAVYTESTANFSAHGGCHCVAGPSFDPNAPRASVIQYVASKRTRTAKERADVRAYLNHNYPDAPG